jgi:hypothetical protein
MKLLRYLARNITVLNVVLAALALLFAVDAVFPLLSVKIGFKARPSPVVASPAKIEPATPLPNPLDYAVVAEENLFHPERRIPPEKKEEALVPKPELVLYGTIVNGDVSVAYVEDKKSPYTTPGRGKRPRMLKKGDAIGGFVLREIEPTRITLVRNEETMVVNLDTVKDRGEGQVRTTAAAGPAMPTVPSRSVLSPLVVNRMGQSQAPTAQGPSPTQSTVPQGQPPAIRR